MKIAQIFENDVDEARRGNWGREQSQAAGQALGKNIAAGLPAADQQRAIQANKTLAGQNQAQADLQARLTQKKAQTAQPAAPAQPVAQEPAAKPSLANRVTGALKKAGDVGAAVTGAVGNVGAGFFGGMKRGYSQQASGGAPVSWKGQASEPAAGGEPQVIQSLMARVSNLERQLSATAESYQFESKYLGKWI